MSVQGLQLLINLHVKQFEESDKLIAASRAILPNLHDDEQRAFVKLAHDFAQMVKATSNEARQNLESDVDRVEAMISGTRDDDWT